MVNDSSGDKIDLYLQVSYHVQVPDVVGSVHIHFEHSEVEEAFLEQAVEVLLSGMVCFEVREEELNEPSIFLIEDKLILVAVGFAVFCERINVRAFSINLLFFKIKM